MAENVLSCDISVATKIESSECLIWIPPELSDDVSNYKLEDEWSVAVFGLFQLNFFIGLRSQIFYQI
jgi:hypothetical protein